MPDAMLSTYSSHREFVSSEKFGDNNDKSLHAGLLPSPFTVNLGMASVYILMLNPGLGPSSYFGEYSARRLRETIARNLRQENGRDKYPFYSLNPEFYWYSDYWHRKFSGLAKGLSTKRHVSHQQALSQIAKNVTCLQLLPYHSNSFGSHRLLKALPSTEAVLEFVHEVVVPKAERDEATIVVTRQVKRWGLKKHKNIIMYDGNAARGAHLGPKSRGGKAIARRLGI